MQRIADNILNETIEPLFEKTCVQLCNGGFNAIRSSVKAVLSLSSILQTSLGPRSMSKMILKDNGEFIITNDGSMILSNIKANHPASKLFVDIALAQDRDVGDGTTSVVLIASEILKLLYEMIEEEEEEEYEGNGGEGGEQQQQQQQLTIHQITLTSLLFKAGQVALSILESDQVSNAFQSNDPTILLKMAGVSLATKHYSYWTNNLINIAYNSIINTSRNNNNNNNNNNNTIDIQNNINIIKMYGIGNNNNNNTSSSNNNNNISNIDNNEFIKGLFISTIKQPFIINNNSNNNNSSSDTTDNNEKRCCILGFDLIDLKNKESFKTHKSISSVNDMDHYLSFKQSRLIFIFNKIKQMNINVVFCKYSLPENLIQMLVYHSISVIQELKDEDITKISTITGAVLLNNQDEFDLESMIGSISIISMYCKFENQYFIHLSNENTFYSTIIIRSPTMDIADDLEIGMIDALYLLKSSMETKPRYVYGGGCCEMSLSMALKRHVQKNNIKGLEARIFEILANAFSVIPSIIGSNCYPFQNTKIDNDSNDNDDQEMIDGGIMSIITRLSFLHGQHLKNQDVATDETSVPCKWGIDGWTGRICDISKLGIIEPLVLKKSIINAAIESCITLLRIDTIISCSVLNPPIK
ncbi:hypothetical protein DFA_01723 [Cavenderia fasciculata]|uniref:Uncharacterized protein n=1 Tax=Cavenderia fasciculata TaxID=261658 RepID=F4PUC2_CACFS|nr:uncharacterized protein DFA_01723 [Cavenderia fasciculata]EGG21837.1 hypothetical protein DFA_01723 [Cavenderia fasciculata]|eukprot:XP_004359687.1 hypothetical protein DFA_01723 [Cavenderia fasciculata]